MMAWLRRHAWVVGAAVLSLVVTMRPFGDGDVWWHLALGRYIFAHGIPATEPFSFLHAANPWTGQQWLYEVGLARVVDLAGPGLASLLAGVAASAALLIATLSIPPERRPAGPWMAAGLLLSALLTAQIVGVRAEVVSLLLAAIVLYVLMHWRRGSTRVLLLLPPLFALWANLDTGFVAGLGIAVVALVAAGDVDRRSRRLLALAVGAAALATLANPAGPGLWGYVGAAFTNPTVTGVITEWQSPNFHDMWLRLFEAEAILLVVAWVLAPRRDIVHVLLAGLAFAASLQAQRNISLFALIAAPQIALYGAQAWRAHGARLVHAGEWARSRRAPAWAGAAALLVVVAGTAVGVIPRLSAASSIRYEATNEPMAAATYAAAHLRGHRLYSTDTWGGYLAERFPSGRVVYLYDETAVFGDAAVQQYLEIHDIRPDWSTVVAAAGITDAILPEGAQEVSAFVTLGWSVDCHDSASSSVVMSATGPSGRSTDPVAAPAAILSAPACA